MHVIQKLTIILIYGFLVFVFCNCFMTSSLSQNSSSRANTATVPCKGIEERPDRQLRCRAGGNDLVSIQWHLPKIVRQEGPLLCWEASLRMLYLWKHLTPDMSRYNNIIGQKKGDGKELLREDITPLATKLGMKEFAGGDSKQAARHFLQSPLIIGAPGTTINHAYVLIGFDLDRGIYTLVDPATGREFSKSQREIKIFDFYWGYPNVKPSR